MLLVLKLLKLEKELLLHRYDVSLKSKRKIKTKKNPLMLWQKRIQLVIINYKATLNLEAHYSAELKGTILRKV